MLTTLDRLKNLLDIPKEDFGLSDDYLEALIMTVTSFVEGKTGRNFSTNVYEDYIPSQSRLTDNNILLPNAPVKSVEKLQWSQNLTDWSDYSGVVATDTGLYVPTGINTTSFHRVSYTGEYKVNWNEDDHTLPEELAMLAERICTKIHNQRGSEGQTAVSFGDTNLTYAEAVVSTIEKNIMERYTFAPIV